MDDTEAGDLLSAISGMVVREAALEGRTVFLYAEAQEAVVSTSIFMDRGDLVEYLDGSHDLAMSVLDYWHRTDAGKKWAALLLTTDGKKFDVRFQYPDEWGDEDEVERREKVLSAQYGDKKIHYPSIQDLD